jgi:hypothetical protein
MFRYAYLDDGAVISWQPFIGGNAGPERSLRAHLADTGYSAEKIDAAINAVRAGLFVFIAPVKPMQIGYLLRWDTRP